VDDKTSRQPSMLLEAPGSPDEKQALQAQRSSRRMTSSSFWDWSRVRHARPTAGSWRASALGVDVPEGWVPSTFLVAELKGRLSAGFDSARASTPHLAEVGAHRTTGASLASFAAVNADGHPGPVPWRSRRRLVLTVYS